MIDPDTLALVWAIGTLSCVILLYGVYMALGNGKPHYRLPKSDCVFCDNYTCPECVEKVTKSLARRDLLQHKRGCPYRQSLGTVDCECGVHDE